MTRDEALLEAVFSNEGLFTMSPEELELIKKNVDLLKKSKSVVISKTMDVAKKMVTKLKSSIKDDDKRTVEINYICDDDNESSMKELISHSFDTFISSIEKTRIPLFRKTLYIPLVSVKGASVGRIVVGAFFAALVSVILTVLGTLTVAISIGTLATGIIGGAAAGGAAGAAAGGLAVSGGSVAGIVCGSIIVRGAPLIGTLAGGALGAGGKRNKAVKRIFKEVKVTNKEELKGKSYYDLIVNFSELSGGRFKYNIGIRYNIDFNPLKKGFSTSTLK